MKFSLDTKKELTIFKLHEKRLDAVIAPELKSQLVILIEAEKLKYLIIDLSQVDAIDSSGIGALLVAHRQTNAHDGFAAFIGVRESVRDLLRMTNLDKQLYIFNSVQEVLNNLEAVETDDEEEDDKVLDDEAEDADDLLSGIPEIAVEAIGDIDIPLEELEEPGFADDGEKSSEKSSKSKAKNGKRVSKPKAKVPAAKPNKDKPKQPAAKLKTKKKS
jgi:anti-anti-sigma factor